MLLGSIGLGVLSGVIWGPFHMLLGSIGLGFYRVIWGLSSHAIGVHWFGVL